MKECRKCGEEKPLEEFYKSKRAADGLQSYCKVCNRGANSSWASRNPEKAAESKRKTQQAILRFIREDKESKGCASCGIKDWRVLDYDHIDPSTKEFTIGRAPGGGVSRPRLVAEIAKCQVLCANCHRIKTYENRDTTRPEMLH